VTATTVLAAAVCPPGPPRSGWVAFADGIVQEVGDGRAPSGAVDLGERVLAPGFVDLQVNGVGAIDFATAPPEAWTSAFVDLAQHGTTACCPTFVSAPRASYDGFLERARRAFDTEPHRGARMLGVHLEGPFLGGAPGAHPPDLLTNADTEWIVTLLERHPGLVRIVTLAPEADPDHRTTRALAEGGMVVALGHSTASYDEAIAATDAGATVVTHLFNGMAPLHHRNPGLVGAALVDERLTPTLIGDLVHVHPAVLRFVSATKPNVAIVSDVVATTSGRAVDGAIRTTDGILAGATALIDLAVANLVSIGIPLERAVEMASTVPARVVGASDRGRIVPGGRADFVVLDPITAAVQQTWVGGEAVGVDPAL
jgi:N-acetylglucosamine-6-phosphate deacetylase